MRKMRRRQFLGAAMLPLGALSLYLPANIALGQQMSGKPQVKLSEMRPSVKEYVERMAQTTKEQTGIELSKEKQAEIVNIILSKMETQGTYDFVDP